MTVRHSTKGQPIVLEWHERPGGAWGCEWRGFSCRALQEDTGWRWLVVVGGFQLSGVSSSLAAVNVAVKAAIRGVVKAVAGSGM